MPAQKVQPYETDPPIEKWTELLLPSNGSVTALRSVANMPALQILDTNFNPIAELCWDDLRHVRSFYMEQVQIPVIEAYRATSMFYLNIGNSLFTTTIDAHGLADLQMLIAPSCDLLSSVDVSGCPDLTFVNLQWCALPQAAVDQVLFDLVDNGASNGNCYLNLGSNAPPSNPDGEAAKNTLVSRGWTVATN